MLQQRAVFGDKAARVDVLPWWKRKNKPNDLQSTRSRWKQTAAPAGGVSPFPLPRGDGDTAPSWHGDLARERWGVRSSRAGNSPRFLLGHFTSSSLLGSACTAGREGKTPQTQTSTTNSPSGWGGPPRDNLEPCSPTYISGGFAALQSLDSPLFPAAAWLLVGHRPAPCPNPPARPPRFSGWGGPAQPGELSNTQVSCYSLLEGYYRLPHLENYSFFRPFRNFNELF